MTEDAQGSVHLRRATGPGAGALKYDILTALLVLASRGESVEARLALRLSLLIVARYNWRSGIFSVGQVEIARMWGVTSRTAKRDLAAMRQRGWISVARPATRGRVAEHHINLSAVLAATMPEWDAVGPDFAARMTGAPEPEATNVVPLHPSPVTVEADGTGWADAAERLRTQDPGVYGAWFAGLSAAGSDGGILTLEAPTRFIADYITTHYLPRLAAAMAAVDRSVRVVRVIAAEA